MKKLLFVGAMLLALSLTGCGKENSALKMINDGEFSEAKAIYEQNDLENKEVMIFNLSKAESLIQKASLDETMVQYMDALAKYDAILDIFESKAVQDKRDNLYKRYEVNIKLDEAIEQADSLSAEKKYSEAISALEDAKSLADSTNNMNNSLTSSQIEGIDTMLRVSKYWLTIRDYNNKGLYEAAADYMRIDPDYKLTPSDDPVLSYLNAQICLSKGRKDDVSFWIRHIDPNYGGELSEEIRHFVLSNYTESQWRKLHFEWRSEEYASAKLHEEVREYNSRKPRIGMTAEEARNSTWGKPKKINKTTTEYGTSEQWVYGSRYLYFEDGVLSAIQE